MRFALLTASFLSPHLVEQKTMHCVGEENLKGWKITNPREGVIPERVRIQAAIKLEETKRMEEQRKQTVAVV